MRWPFRLREKSLIAKMAFGLLSVSEKVMQADFFTRYILTYQHTLLMVGRVMMIYFANLKCFH